VTDEDMDVPDTLSSSEQALLSKLTVDESQIGPFLPDIYKKLEWLERDELIKHFVSAEFNRYLSYYKNAKDINVSEKHGSGCVLSSAIASYLALDFPKTKACYKGKRYTERFLKSNRTKLGYHL